MSVVITLDPALGKILDSLNDPVEDPDRRLASVWISWCEGVYLIPVGEYTTVNFGTWYGPSMLVTDIIFHCRYLWMSGQGQFWGPKYQSIHPYDDLEGNIIVKINF
jgi:hypothetical protein